MTVDFTKPVQTRDGRQVRIYATDGGGEFPIHGAIKHPDDEWETMVWCATGAWLIDEPDRHDLINVPEKRTAWLNVMPDGHGHVHLTHEHADRVASEKRIARIKVEYTVGQFDE